MKLAKLSLAAIVAAGALTTVNAQPLEEAIKGVDFSGFARYRYHHVETGENDATAASKDTNDYDLKAKFVAPVTEDLKFTSVFTVGGSNADSNYKDGGVSTKSFDLGKMFFTYTNGALTVQAGRQAIGAPIVDNGYRGHKGTGVVGLYNLGSVTLAAAYYNTSNAFEAYAADYLKDVYNAKTDAEKDAIDAKATGLDAGEITAVAAIGSFGPVNGQVWAIQMVNAIDHLLFFQLDGQVIDGLTLKGQYINTKLDEGVQATVKANDDSGDFYGIQATYAIDAFKFNAGYTNNDANQPIHAFATDANDDVIHAGYRLNDDKDVNFMGGDQYFVDGTYTYGKFGFMLGYAQWDEDKADNAPTTDKEETLKETWGGISYAYSKNFNTYVKYSDISADEDKSLEQKFLRFEAKYSF